MTRVIETYVSDGEYPTFFSILNGVRQAIAKDLPIEENARILDLATGYAYFAIELARLRPDVEIVGIDISKDDVEIARENIAKCGLTKRVHVVRMDATHMDFPDESFDSVVNFLGFEDIYMTRGKSGVGKTFLEVGRILKPNRDFCLVAMPPEEMETAAQKLEVRVFSYTCGAIWLSFRDYSDMLRKAGLRPVSKENYYTGKKLTAGQARQEIIFACQNVPTIYGIKTPPFERIWELFGKEIEQEGLGHYSKVTLIRAKKDPSTCIASR